MTRRRREAVPDASGSMAGSSLTESTMGDITTSTDGDAEAIPPPETFALPARRRRWPFLVVLGLVAVIGISAIVLGQWKVGYYALTPGDATPVAPFIKVPKE